MEYTKEEEEAVRSFLNHGIMKGSNFDIRIENKDTGDRLVRNFETMLHTRLHNGECETNISGRVTFEELIRMVQQMIEHIEERMNEYPDMPEGFNLSRIISLLSSDPDMDILQSFNPKVSH